MASQQSRAVYSESLNLVLPTFNRVFNKDDDTRGSAVWFLSLSAGVKLAILEWPALPVHIGKPKDVPRVIETTIFFKRLDANPDFIPASSRIL